MEEGQPDGLVAFAELASELLGRAISACMASDLAPHRPNYVHKKVKVELIQSAQQPEQVILRVSDEGEGLPLSQAALQRALAPLHRPMTHPAVGTLTLRTTMLSESVVRRYSISSMDGQVDIHKLQIQETKPPGLQLTGTQATLTLSSEQVPPESALAACESLLEIVSTLSPPVHLTFKVQGLMVPPSEVPSAQIYTPTESNTHSQYQGTGSQNHQTVANQVSTPTPAGTSHFPLGDPTPVPVPLSFIRQLEPLPQSTSFSPLQLLQLGLKAEFPSGTPAPPLAATGATPHGQHLPGTVPLRLPLPLPVNLMLHYIGAGEAPAPRGCKWKACAGVVLQIPDHALLHAQGINSQGNLPGMMVESEGRWEGQGHAQQQISHSSVEITAENVPNNTMQSVEPAPVYIFKAHALQMVQREVAATALPRVDWTGHGIKFLAVKADPSAPGPLEVTLQSAQPESLATIVALVVHLYPEPVLQESSETRGKGAAGSYPRLAERHEGALIRGAIDAALAHLKQQCPGVMSSRRERSLSRALPVVSSAVAGILLRAVGEGVLEEACQALGTEPQDLVDKLQLALEEAVTAPDGEILSTARE